jgi:hypothetical protein
MLQLKYILAINALLGFLFVVSNYYIWTKVNELTKFNVASLWSPILVSGYRIPNLPTVAMPVGPYWNLPFMLFWVILVVNIYFIIRLQRSKAVQTKNETIKN